MYTLYSPARHRPHRRGHTTAVVERRLAPGTKLAEQKLADRFGVSRTLVRQALNQLSRDRLVTLTPARGDGRTAARLMQAHLESVERDLHLDPAAPDLASILQPEVTR